MMKVELSESYKMMRKMRKIMMMKRNDISSRPQGVKDSKEPNPGHFHHHLHLLFHLLDQRLLFSLIT